MGRLREDVEDREPVGEGDVLSRLWDMDLRGEGDGVWLLNIMMGLSLLQGHIE